MTYYAKNQSVARRARESIRNIYSDADYASLSFFCCHCERRGRLVVDTYMYDLLFFCDYCKERVTLCSALNTIDDRPYDKMSIICDKLQDRYITIIKQYRASLK